MVNGPRAASSVLHEAWTANIEVADPQLLLKNKITVCSSPQRKANTRGGAFGGPERNQSTVTNQGAVRDPKGKNNG